MKEFNLNDYVYVQLTDLGREKHKKEFNELNEWGNGVLGEYSPPDEDKNGYSKWQLWNLMSTFGKYMGNGFPDIFKTMNIQLEE